MHVHFLQNLSSCIVLDEDSAEDETTTATKSTIKSPASNPSHIASMVPPSGICNPGFDFEDDELDFVPKLNNKMASLAEEEEPITSVDILVSRKRSCSDYTVETLGDTNVLVKKDEIITTMESDGEEPPCKSAKGEIPFEDTDEDVKSISMDVEEDNEADDEMGEKVSKKKKLVSVRRKSDRLVVQHQERGNVKIVEIKSRDVVQGILRMEPNLATSKDHVALVKVPLPSVQGPRGQLKGSSQGILGPSKRAALCESSGASAGRYTPKVRSMVNVVLICLVWIACGFVMLQFEVANS